MNAFLKSMIRTATAMLPDAIAAQKAKLQCMVEGSWRDRSLRHVACSVDLVCLQVLDEPVLERAVFLLFGHAPQRCWETRSTQVLFSVFPGLEDHSKYSFDMLLHQAVGRGLSLTVQLVETGVITPEMRRG